MTLEKAVGIYDSLPAAKTFPAYRYMPYNGGFVIVGRVSAPGILGCNTYWIRQDSSVMPLLPSVIADMDNPPNFKLLKHL